MGAIGHGDERLDRFAAAGDGLDQRQEGQVEEDVDLSEFSDEIEAWVIDELNRIGLDTAKSVLALSKDELVRRTDLEEETVDSVLNILKKEFE